MCNSKHNQYLRILKLHEYLSLMIIKIVYLRIKPY